MLLEKDENDAELLISSQQGNTGCLGCIAPPPLGVFLSATQEMFTQSQQANELSLLEDTPSNESRNQTL